MNIQIQITGVSEINEKLNRLGMGLYKMDNAMRQIGQYLAMYYANEAFASQGQVFGSSWPRLSQKYSVWKAKHFPGRGMEELTGEMRASFGFEAGSSSVRIYNTSDHFAYNQLGTSRMPARPMMGFSAANKMMIKNIITEDIKKKLASV